jgi:hypothetical protein
MEEFITPPRKPSLDDRRRFADFFIALVLLTTALIGISLLMGQAKRSDFSQEKIFNSSCAVKDKEITPNRLGRDYNTYTVKTSCGNFVTDADLYETIAQGETYDITATAGNWANKPTIVLIEPSAG